jgi:rhamnosyltransferase subunit B
MRVVLASLGTAGDIHPFLAIGRHLVAHGHRAELISNPVFAPLAARAGIDFTPVGDPAHFHATCTHPSVWHPLNGFGVMWRYLARPAIPAALARLEAAASEPDTVTLYSPFLMPAPRIAMETRGLRAVSAWTAPQMLPRFAPPLWLAGRHLGPDVPATEAREAVLALDRGKMQPLALPDVEAARSARGLPALERSIFLDWIHSPLLSIALFPASFAAATPEWPHPHLHAGFPLYDDDAAPGLDPALAQFLDAGPPPVVFTAGTAMHDARAFFADAVDASVALGLRALLLAQDAAQLPEVLPPGVIHVPYAPFSLLLPRARALVHHGGVGTLAQALRAGLPQLAVPQAYDQFDNASRLVALGVAHAVFPGEDGTRLPLRDALSALLADTSVPAACARMAADLDGHNAFERVRLALESLA